MKKQKKKKMVIEPINIAMPNIYHLPDVGVLLSKCRRRTDRIFCSSHTSVENYALIPYDPIDNRPTICVFCH